MPNPQRQQLKTLGSLLHAAALSTLALAGLAFYLWLYVPRSHEIAQLQTRITALQQQLRGSAKIRGQFATLTASRAEQRQTAEDVRRRVPDEPREAEFLEQISDAILPDEFVINDYTRGPVTKADGCRQLDIQLRCDGTYAGICRFLDRLDRMQRITRVVALDLGTQMTQQRYPLSITVRLYFGAQQAAGKPGDRVASVEHGEVRDG